MLKISSLVLVFSFLSLYMMAAPDTLYAQNTAQAIPQSKTQIQLSFAPVVRQTAPAVVNIYAQTLRTEHRRGGIHPFANDPFFAPFFHGFDFGERRRQRVMRSLGSGFIVSPEGLVVTNAHVIDNASDISVTLQDGSEYDAALVIQDQASDLALLQIMQDDRADQPQSFPFLRFANTETLEVGDLVLAIGNPFGVGQSVTSGIVSAVSRSATNINDFNFFIQTDAAINPGNSGGPLMTLQGDVAGINTAIYSRDGGSLGIGFAVPAEMAAYLVNAQQSGTLQKNAKGQIIRPWTGLSLQDITSDMKDALDLSSTRGALIKSLHRASPATKAGLRAGDVVTSFNARPIVNMADMQFRLATTPLNKDITLQILRQNREHQISFRAIAPPETPPRNSILIERSGTPFDGLELSTLSPALAVSMGLDFSAEGVVITDAQSQRDMRRMRLGFREGDILRAVNGSALEDTQQAKALFERLKREQPRSWRIDMIRDGQTRSIILR
jgi:Do/DeqQ family serine protease